MGNYFVTAVLDNCVESAIDSAVSRHLVNGLEDLSFERSIKVYPSPFRNELVIEMPGTGAVGGSEVSVYTVDGKLVYQNNYQETKFTVINTASFEKGLYITEVVCSGRTFRQKVVKE